MRKLKYENDILERHKHSGAYNRVLFESSPIGLALCKMSGELVDVNPAYAKIIGREVLETLKLSYWDITPKKYEEEETIQLKIIQATNKYGPFEKEYIHKDGHLVPVRLSGQVIEIDGDSYLWSSVEDISQIVMSEKQKMELKKQLEQAQKLEAIGQLVAGIAHDFNNTLGCITGYGSLAMDQIAQGNTDKIPTYLKRILKAGDQSRDMIDKLLTFIRGTGSENETVDLNVIARDAVDLLSVAIPGGIKVHLDLENEPTLIQGNGNQLKQVIMNLCINARDAIGDKGEIFVHVKQIFIPKRMCQSCQQPLYGDFLQLSIKDSGSGIPKEHLTRVFDPFFSTKPQGSGTGLGLSMVHGITHELNGHITVKSSKNTGTEINLLFPLQQHSVRRLENPKMQSNEEDSSGSILVVDDNESHASLIEEILSLNNFTVVKTTSPTEALKKFKEKPHQFNLVVSDQIMPEMTGIQLSSRIQEIRDDIPIVICTGYSEYDKASLLNMGFEGVLRKPVSFDELISVCGKYAPH